MSDPETSSNSYYLLYKKFLNATLGKSQRVNLVNVLKQVFPPEKATALDIGTGNGAFAKMMEQAIPQLSFHGTDVISRGEPCINITLYDGNTLPFPDGSFDYCTMINMLHHTKDPVQIMQEAIRVCRKGIIIKDHYANDFISHTMLYVMEYLNPNLKDIRHQPLRFYSKKEWDEIFFSINLKEEMLIRRFVSYGKFLDLFFGGDKHFVAKYAKPTL